MHESPSFAAPPGARPNTHHARALRRAVLALAATLALGAAHANGCTTSFSGGTGSPTDPFQIATPDDLTDLRDDVLCWGYHYRQTADLDLNGGVWTSSIGTSPTTAFVGSYDGGGHALRNLHIDADATHVGLFGYADGASLTDLRLLDVRVDATDSSAVGETASTAGALAGVLVDGAVRRVSATGAVTTDVGTAGGLVGVLRNATAERIETDVAVSADEAGGGVVGVTAHPRPLNETGTAALRHVVVRGDVHVGRYWGGGVIGRVDRPSSADAVTTIRDAVVHGNVRGGTTTAGELGGMIGQADGRITLERVAMHGSVQGTTDYVGGLVGGTYKGATIRRAHVTGDVFGATYVGGAIGMAGPVTLRDVFVLGDVVGTDQYTGGLIGEAYDAHTAYENVYVRGDVDGRDGVGGLVGYSAANASGPTITNAYVDGAVRAPGRLGALLGIQFGAVDATGVVWNASATDAPATDPVTDDTVSATGVSAAALRTRATFEDAGWAIQDGTGTYQDGVAEWGIDPTLAGGTPFLLWYDPPAPPARDDGDPPDADDGTGTPEDDARLAALALEGATLDPPFDPDRTTYAAAVPRDVDRVRVTAVGGSHATLRIDDVEGRTRLVAPIPIAAGETRTVRIAVTAADGATTATYALTFTRPGPTLVAPTNLTAIPEDGAAWIAFPAPDAAVETYAVDLGDGTFRTLYPDQPTPPLHVTGLANDRTYALRVAPIVDGVRGPASDPVAVRPHAPAPPTVDLPDAPASAPPGAWSGDGATRTRTETIPIVNRGDAVLPSLWLHLDLDAPADADLVVRPAAGAPGTIRAVGGAWFWDGVDLAPGATAVAEVVLTTDAPTGGSSE